MNPYWNIALLIGVAVLQSTLAPFVTFYTVHVNLVLVVVLAWSLLRDASEVVMWALLGGMILDMYSSMPFGIFTISLILTALLANFWQTRQISNTILPILLALPYTFIFNIIVLIGLQGLGHRIGWGAVLSSTVFPEGVVNVAAMAVIYPVFARLNRTSQRNGLSI